MFIQGKCDLLGLYGWGVAEAARAERRPQEVGSCSQLLHLPLSSASPLLPAAGHQSENRSAFTRESL